MTNDGGNQSYHTPWGTPVSIRRFDDKSEIVYYDNGMIGTAFTPQRFDDPPKPPKALLYYWQVERNRPDIETWEQIRQAEKEDKRNL
jgi:hypothetical protein